MYIKNFGEFFINQIEYAGTIILSRTDKVTGDKLKQCVELIREHNAKATIITTPLDQLEGAAVLETIEGADTLEEMMKEMLEHAQEHHHDHEEHEHDHEHHHEGEDEVCPVCGGHHHEDEHHHEHDHGGHEHHHEHDHGGHEHHHDRDHEGHEHDGEDEVCPVCGGHHHDHDHKGHEHHHDHDHEGHDHHHDHEGHEHHHDHDHGEHDHEHHHDHDCGCGHDHDHHHHHADEIFTSWGMETPAAYTQEKIESILTALDSGEYGAVLRAKGMVPAEDGTWIYYDYVPEEHDIRSGKPEVTGKICVIGSELKEEKLAELFRV